ncbi:hypothetical protein DFJ58DRAFT_761747 [Suillus subalutaceus]|uniref:uncharacterized protein n=1 Tax=Suillus subalutaceus TaxID=48586 RepID=UPI001B8615EF|nr:uncharacterized protein DFJ58DRAFT_761747 [Suillus subalutaceus]KAG1872466.1 hypothetical protein DFJ58DRAFT_761747 [Suillus subalutaceus]
MSEIDIPPPYDGIVSPLDSLRPTLFSFLRKKQNVLSCIRHIVSAPDSTPSSIAKIANACAATLTPAQFARLLQKPNIEGHTALYWSIVNHGREAFSALATFVPQFTPVCSSGLRLACIATRDHELFTQLKLGHVVNPEDESLRRFLGCPPDEVQVQSVAGHTPNKNEKRLRANLTQELGIEFIAGGHTWLLMSCMKKEQRCILLSVSDDSLPACVDSCALVVQAPSGKLHSKICEYRMLSKRLPRYLWDPTRHQQAASTISIGL